MKYYFYQERKVIGWERIHFCIEADSPQAAAERLAEIGDNVVMHDTTEDFSVSDRDFLLDNMRDVTVKENNGKATIETYDSEGHLLFDNADRTMDKERIASGLHPEP